jgi:hypothetical protein
VLTHERPHSLVHDVAPDRRRHGRGLFSQSERSQLRDQISDFGAGARGQALSSAECRLDAVKQDTASADARAVDTAAARRSVPAVGQLQDNRATILTGGSQDVVGVAADPFWRPEQQLVPLGTQVQLPSQDEQQLRPTPAVDR